MSPYFQNFNLEKVIRRIKNEGMIIVGLVNMHQVGIATIGTNNSKFHGDCINPVNPDFYPGNTPKK